MRNGVAMIHRKRHAGADERGGVRIFAITQEDADVGRPFADVFRERPDLVRVLAGAFELATLPNRAELRLRNSIASSATRCRWCAVNRAERLARCSSS